jgi:uncharacterized protein YndB with AHSA1/START domain
MMVQVQNTINASINKVWEIWTTPEHIQKWNNPSPDWHNPYVENDLKVGGKFKFTMGTKDGTTEFDFEGVYTKIKEFSLIEYQLFDDRTASVRFENKNNEVIITETFEPEINAESEQKQFCTAIIENFKTYVENLEE